MVYFHTSANVKMLRNILIDFKATDEVSSQEYMKVYIEKCPETIEDTKLSWIAESFLGIQKHNQFLKEIASHLSEEISEEEQDYFVISLHGIIFTISPKDMQLLYKCLFNLSKTLLNTFTNFLSNNEVLTFISQVAQVDYDAQYITEKIIGPLFEWQPYISEMAHNYAEYVKKVESRKVKPLTVPIQPNVLNRKGKDTSSIPVQASFPVTPPNSLRTKTNKMLKKSAIDRRLKNIHDKNEQKATNLLNNVRNQNFHYAQLRPKKHSNIENKSDSLPVLFSNQKPKPFIIKEPSVPVRETAATLKRMNKHIQLIEQEEVNWLETIMFDCRNRAKIEELETFDRQEKERERLLDIERNHLMGQISHEEAAIAKRKLKEYNKKKYEEFLKEKEAWNKEIEKWKNNQMEESRKKIELLSLMELTSHEAKHTSVLKKKESADKVRRETEALVARAMKSKQDELDHRINMIREIKILSMIANKTKVPKIVDLTETAGLGLLCEMSIAELQERLNALKIGIKDEIDRKRDQINEKNYVAKKELDELKNTIKKYQGERATLRKQTKNIKNSTQTLCSKEISNLKQLLEEKRRLRMQLSN